MAERLDARLEAQRLALLELEGKALDDDLAERRRRAWDEVRRLRLEAKAAVRRVRTPEGARHFGAPIGTPIVRDPLTGKLYAAGHTFPDADEPPRAEAVPSGYGATDEARGRVAPVEAFIEAYGAEDGPRKWRTAVNTERVRLLRARDRAASDELPEAAPEIGKEPAPELTGETSEPPADAPPPKPVKPRKPGRIGEARHPESGRPDQFADPLTRGGDGPLFGYSPGDRIAVYRHDPDHAWIYEVLDEPGRVDTSRKWAVGANGAYETKNTRTTHQIRAAKVMPDGTLKLAEKDTAAYPPYHPGQTAGEPEGEWVPVEQAVPLVDVQPRVDPGWRVEPVLAAVDAAPLPVEDLLPADSLEAVRRAMKRKAVALDTSSDTYEGYAPPELIALSHAKDDGLRALGVAMGWDEATTDAAIRSLDVMLEGWRTTGGLFDARERMHRAANDLRRGEPADTDDRRAMLLQRAWSNATWELRYARDARVPISRFVQDSHAAQLEAAAALTKPAYVLDETGERVAAEPLLDPSDVVFDAYPLTSWTVTPGGVHKRWIGKDSASVELKTQAMRDEVWLNVWSEPRFRTSGLKAPGEFILDNRRRLSMDEVEIEVHHPEDTSWHGRRTSPQERYALTLTEHVRRGGEIAAGAAGIELVFDGPAVTDPRLLGIDWIPEVEAGAWSAQSLLPDAPKRDKLMVHPVTGEELTWDQYMKVEDRHEIGKWQERPILVRDAEKEELLDRAAAYAAERGWNQARLMRFREVYRDWLRHGRDSHVRQRGMLRRFDWVRTMEQFDEQRERYRGFEERERVRLKAAAAKLGLDLDDDLLDDLLDEDFEWLKAEGELLTADEAIAKEAA